MSINSILYDPSSAKQATIETKENRNGVHVLTQEYKEYLNKKVFFTNPTYGQNMNQDFSQVDDTEWVHDGNDNTYWTATTIVGSPNDFDFSSTDQAHTGNQSISCVNAEDGDIFQLENDTLLSGSDYNRFVGWIYVDSEWEDGRDGVLIRIWNTNLDMQVSEFSVNLDNYINAGNVDEWQKFNIPFEEFGTLSDDYDAMRFEIVGFNDPPNFYLDDMRLEYVAGGIARFSISPPIGTWWHVNGISIALAAPYNSTLTDGTVPNIPYNGLLGVQLVDGITYIRTFEGEIIFSYVVTDLIEVLNLFNTRVTNVGYDGNYTWITVDIELSNPHTIKSEYEDHFSFTFGDDLNSFAYFRISAEISEERRI